MGEARSETILRRKASEGRREHLAKSATPQRALKMALARTAEEALELPLSVTGMEELRLNADALTTQLPEDGIFLLLDGPGGALGAVMADVQVLSALVEQQTIARVVKRPAPDRPPTRVDAALLAPLLDGVFARLDEELADQPLNSFPLGFRYGAMLEDRRAICLALTATQFDLIRLKLDLGLGAKQGEMLLVLPEGEAQGSKASKGKQQASQALRAAVMQAPTQFNAVLTRIEMSYAQLQALKVGDRLPFPAASLTQARLEAAGGEQIARVTLGQLNGQRAVRFALPGAAGAAKTENNGAPEPVPSVPAASTIEPPQPQVDAPPSDALQPAMDADAVLDDLDDLSDLDELEDLALPPPSGG